MGRRARGSPADHHDGDRRGPWRLSRVLGHGYPRLPLHRPAAVTRQGGGYRHDQLRLESEPGYADRRIRRTATSLSAHGMPQIGADTDRAVFSAVELDRIWLAGGHVVCQRRRAVAAGHRVGPGWHEDRRRRDAGIVRRVCPDLPAAPRTYLDGARLAYCAAECEDGV